VEKKYQIFISSTYNDLTPEKEAIIRICLQMGNLPVGMEMFNPADETQWKIITRSIDQSDYYVVIVAHRYGSKDNGISYTEKEYRYTRSNGVPSLRFVIDPAAAWPVNLIDQDEADRTALEKFKGELCSKMVAFWSAGEELRERFAIALPQAINLHPRPGWTRIPDWSDPLPAGQERLRGLGVG
jgi:hypothetical protein